MTDAHIPTAENTLQAPVTHVERIALKFRRISYQFGWPALFLFLVGPRSQVGQDSWAAVILLWLGIPAVLSGLALRVWSRGYFRMDGFVMDGPYRYVRNPVELGALFGFVGASITMGLPAWYTVLVLLAAVIYLSFVGLAADRLLVERHGGAYLRYARRVSRWIPNSLPAANRSNRSFSLLHALSFERESFVWALGYVIIFALRRHLDWH
jgi:protein-S-isoprenylcysteine O-methyltransferase Ste14